MTFLLEMREKLRNFYGKYEIYVAVAVKFILGIVVFLWINSGIGYLERLNQLAVVLLLALLCAFLPIGAMVAAACGLALLHFSALSLEVCAIWLGLVLLLFFLYWRFAPGHGYSALLTPLLCYLRVPQVMPVAMGLLEGPSSYFSVLSGAAAFFYVRGIQENIAVFTSGEEAEGFSRLSSALKLLVENKEMYLFLVSFLATSVIVYAIRRQSMAYAWKIAIFVGNLVQMIILLTGYILLAMPGRILWVILGTLLSVGISLILEFFFFNLDYSRVERVQFEDDEYYYYVKAVPKVFVAKKDKRVKRITPKNRTTVSRKQLAEELDIDQDLLD